MGVEEALMEYANCSYEEAEEIVFFLQEAIDRGQLFDYQVIDDGVYLIRPNEEFIDEFVSFLVEELRYNEPEIYYRERSVEVIF